MNEYLSKEGLRQLCIKIRKALQRVPNDNLLDNWYFVGGGSQLGWGLFPVNQLNQVEYAGPGYGIDRWEANLSGCSLSLGEAGISFTNSVATARRGLFQTTGRHKDLAGRYVTLSTLSRCTSGSFQLGLGFSGKNLTANSGNFANTDFDVVSYTYKVPDTATALTAWILANGNSAGDIVAAMLEPGTEQHLAHKEGGRWVLNRVPDYGEELRKCKNYQVISNIPENGFIGRTSNNAQSATVFLPLPTTLRADALFTAKSLELIGNGHSVILNDVSVMMATGSNGGWIGLSGDFSAIGAYEIVQGMAYYGYSIDANP